MKTGILSIAAAALCFAVVSGVAANAATEQWLTGTLVAADLSGHGPDPAGRTALARSWDMWWNYCLAAGGRSYSAVGRISPAGMGLTIHGPVRFLVERDRIIIQGRTGKRHTLRRANMDGCRSQ